MLAFLQIQNKILVVTLLAVKRAEFQCFVETEQSYLPKHAREGNRYNQCLYSIHVFP